MRINFATNQRQTALAYIQQSLPSRTITEAMIERTLALVDDGHVRVGDPMMYGGKAPIFPSEKYQPEDADTVMKELSSFLNVPHSPENL